ncbi:hypothetical protein NQZ68_031863 [Dissostichus eleginoides]|nr:hypothetical protein NQZ68_031863 [Dissostichus eleginoides]
MIPAQPLADSERSQRSTSSFQQWTGDEVKAIERHLNPFITSCRVPGKRDCDSCLKAEPVALKDRDWSTHMHTHFSYRRKLQEKLHWHSGQDG